MKKLVFLLALVAFQCSFALTLTVGTAPQNPPFGDIADQQGNFFGFDIDIMMKICNRIHAKCNFKPFTYNDLFSQINNKQIDLAISAIIINSDEKDNFIFTLPYLESNAQFLALKTSSVKSPKNINSKIVGTRRGTLFKDLARLLYQNKIKSIEYPDVASMLDALKNVDVDVILLNSEAAKYWYANNSDLYRLVGTKIPVGDGYAIMANKDNGPLIGPILRFVPQSHTFIIFRSEICQ